MMVHDLMVQALLNEDREAAVHALMLDPLTAAVCSLSEIRQMFDEMASTQKAYLPHFINPD
jgi:alpha-galactosidase